MGKRNVSLHLVFAAVYAIVAEDRAPFKLRLAAHNAALCAIISVANFGETRAGTAGG